MMAFKITRCKSWLDTLKTINSSSQPSHSSSTNHAVRVSVTQWWGPGLWFLLLLRQSPAVGTCASYFCPELQRALDIQLCLKVWPFTLVCLPHILSAFDCHSPLMYTCSSLSPGRPSQEGSPGFAWVCDSGRKHSVPEQQFGPWKSPHWCGLCMPPAQILASKSK